MKCVPIAFAAAAVSANAADSQVAVTPLQKVLELLDGMESKGKAEKHNEEVEFSEFSQWCESTRQATTKSIKQAEEELDQLDADMAKADADAERLAGEIAEHDAATEQAQDELSKARDLRGKEHADFLATEADLSESIDAIERAINVLRSREADVPQSLLQVANLHNIPREAKATITSFISMMNEADDEMTDAPSANAYEFQSGGVVEMLEKLRTKFQDQKLALQKSEMNTKANFMILAQKLEDNIAEEKKQSNHKTARRAQRLEASASAKADIEATKVRKADDEKKLQDTLASCRSRTEEYNKNQAVRADEIKAIQQALEILRSDDVQGNADEHLPKLIQTSVRRTTALVQLRGGESPQESQHRERIALFLNGRAQDLHSQYLALVATHAGADPFAKVKNMVKDLITKLSEQANAEADHHAYCTTELATNKLTRENKQTEVDKLSATIDQNTAQLEQLAEEITELCDSLGELRREQAEATALRHKEKETNEQTIADAQVAQTAVERATKALRDFYEKAGSGAFVQEPYTGMQSEHTGVVGMLEVILSDFARLEAETNTAEDQAATAYDKFMDESNEDIAVKETAKEHKKKTKDQVEASTENLKKELELTQEEFDAANLYYDNLKPDCVDNGLSYEDRVRMRKEEIQSLKDAYKMLEQGDLA